jgi:hypothetical protein
MKFFFAVRLHWTLLHLSYYGPTINTDVHYLYEEKRELYITATVIFHYDFVANLLHRNGYLLYCNTCINNKTGSILSTRYMFVFRLMSE